MNHKVILLMLESALHTQRAVGTKPLVTAVMAEQLDIFKETFKEELAE